MQDSNSSRGKETGHPSNVSLSHVSKYNPTDDKNDEETTHTEESTA